MQNICIVSLYCNSVSLPEPKAVSANQRKVQGRPAILFPACRIANAMFRHLSGNIYLLRVHTLDVPSPVFFVHVSLQRVFWNAMWYLVPPEA